MRHDGFLGGYLRIGHLGACCIFVSSPLPIFFALVYKALWEEQVCKVCGDKNMAIILPRLSLRWGCYGTCQMRFDRIMQSNVVLPCRASSAGMTLPLSYPVGGFEASSRD